MTESGKITLNQILWGLVVPLIIGIVIIAFPLWISPLVSDLLPFPLALSAAEIILLTAIPLFIGLAWNKWAGGAAGFLLGTLYYLASSGYNYVLNQVLYGSLAGGGAANYAVDAAILQYNMWSDITQLGVVVVAMLTGYIAGALSNRSMSFKRMLGASLTSVIATGTLSFLIKTTSPMITDYPYAAFITFLPLIIFAILIPVIAKISAGSELTPGMRY